MSGFVINSVALSGNLTRDPELRSTNSGVSVCDLRIASNERVKDQASGDWTDRAMFFDVTIWKGMGEWVANNLSKGDPIVVNGRLRWREYEHDGQKRQAIDITADSIVPMRDGGSGGGGGGARQTSNQDIPIDTGGLAAGTASAADDTDEIPF